MTKTRLYIEESTFTIVANGFADGPAQALRDYLIKKGAKRVITVAHPLVPEGSNEHVTTVYENGEVKKVRSRKLPHKPPYTYMQDPFVPMRLPADDVWFGFNNLACMRGLARRKMGRTKKVVYWAVDFSPQRFGPGAATKAYDKVDSIVARNADARVELSRAALDGRTEYLHLDKKSMAAGVVIPMGAWLDRTEKTTAANWKAKKLVYLGHLVERQGVDTLVRAAEILIKSKQIKSLEVVGAGPMLEDLKKLAKTLKVDKYVTFHGFVKDHRDVEKILASGTVAVAPYKKDPDSFTQFADPGKLKAYLGAGLPIVLTAVPPNTQELADAGAALVAEDSAESVAKQVAKLLEDEKKWQKSREAVTKKATEFDWNTLLSKGLKELGVR